MIVVKELEPDLPDGAVTWNSNLNISFPHFRPTAHEEPLVKLLQEESTKQSNRRKFHKKVKTSSTQTEPQLQAASQPGMRYIETSPGKELFDSFSSLSSINCTMSPQQVAPQEQVNNLINSLIMETTKTHLTDTNTQHGDRKRQKNKKTRRKEEKMTCHNVSLSSTTHERLKDNTLLQSDSSPVHVPSTTTHSIVTHTPAVARQLQHSSGDIVTHYIHKQPDSNDTVTHHTQAQPYSSDTMTHHTQEQPHSSDIMTHHTQEQPHSSDMVTHHTQEQPHSSDIVTHHTQEQSRIIQQVKHWSKFEQLRVKYLPQSTPSSVTSDNHKMLHSGFKMRN